MRISVCTAVNANTNSTLLGRNLDCSSLPNRMSVNTLLILSCGITSPSTFSVMTYPFPISAFDNTLTSLFLSSAYFFISCFFASSRWLYSLEYEISFCMIRLARFCSFTSSNSVELHLSTGVHAFCNHVSANSSSPQYVINMRFAPSCSSLQRALKRRWAFLSRRA